MGRAVAAAQRQHSGEWVPVRDANASLDRIAAAAMPAEPFAHHQIGAREGAFNIAEGEPAIIGNVAVFALQDMRAFSHRCPDRIDDRLQRLVFHVDELQGVFSTASAYPVHPSGTPNTGRDQAFTSFPVSTAATPGSLSARVVSIDLINAWACGLLRMAACSMPRGLMSLPYSTLPVINSGSSILGLSLPT